MGQHLWASLFSFFSLLNFLFFPLLQEDGAASLGFALSLERLVPRLEAALNSL
jgi:hypothetical protein